MIDDDAYALGAELLAEETLNAHRVTAAGLPMGTRYPRSGEILCCLLKAAVESLNCAGLLPLSSTQCGASPDPADPYGGLLVYPSLVDNPGCPTRANLTAFVTDLQPVAPGETCPAGWRGTVTLRALICTAVDLTKIECATLGTCDDPDKGTYAGEALVGTAWLEALAGAARFFECSPCEQPELVGTIESTVDGNRIGIGAVFTITW